MRAHFSPGHSAQAVLLALVVAVPSAPRAQEHSSDVFDQFFRFGDTSHKVYAQEAPGETVDPFTGTLRIVQEDLVLPGKGGLDLRIVRTYSSKIWARTDPVVTDPLLAESEHSVLGYGWTFHMGRLKNPYAIVTLADCNSAEFPVFVGPDGQTHDFYPVSPFDVTHAVFRSKDHWRLEINCPALGSNEGACVWSSDGIRYEFSNAPGNPYFEGTRPVWPLSRVVDPNGNHVDVEYIPSTGAVAKITDSYRRQIDFDYLEGQDGRRLVAIRAGGKTFSYDYTAYGSEAGAGRALPGPRRFLTAVRPPVGGVQQYEYGYANSIAQNQYALTKVTTPHGGTTEFQYESVPFFTGRDMVPFAVVTRRTVGGRGLQQGVWIYSYASPPARCSDTNACAIDPESGTTTNFHVTTVTRPDGRVDSYKIVGFGHIADRASVTSRLTYSAGLTVEAARANRAEVETSLWAPDTDHPISNVTYGAPVYGGNCGVYLVWDDAVWAPLLMARQVRRDRAAFETHYSGFDAYGQAQTVVEYGYQGVISASSAAVPPAPAVRTTRWTYFSTETEGGATLNMVKGRPLAQHVCVSGECFDNNWTYDGPGHLRDTQTLSGVRTTFAYDPASGDLASVTNAAGETLRLSAYQYGVPTIIERTSPSSTWTYRVTREATWDGWVRKETDARGNSTSYAYDDIGRVLSIAPPEPSLPTTYDYRPGGRSDGEAVLLAKGSYYSRLSELDGFGRTLATSDSEGIHSQALFDPMRNVTFKSYPYGADGAAGDAMEYDGLGRVVQVAKGYRPDRPMATCSGDGVCSVSYYYDINCTRTAVQRTSADTIASWRCDTSFGDPGEARLTAISEPPVGGEDERIWRYAYNAAGKLTALTAPVPAGNRSFTYDAHQFLQTETTAESGTVHFDRDNIGRVTGRRDARGVTATYGYGDPLGRLTNEQWQTDDDVTRTYEAGNLKHMASGVSGAFDYQYDEVNRVTLATWEYRGAVYGTGYEYDVTGCLRSITYPTGTVVTQACDGLNRVKSISIRRLGGSVETIVNDDLTYHPSGQPLHFRFGNGATTDNTYDDRGRLSTLTAAYSTVTGPQPIAGLTYGYDGAGNVVSFDNTAQIGSARTMTYDALDRLETSISMGQWGYTTYRYDALGNLTAKLKQSGATEYFYDPATNRLAYSTGPGPTTVGLRWDAPGRLAASSDQATYRYDPAGRRIEKIEATGSTVYHYDVAGRVIAETRPDGSKLRDYIYLGNKLVAVDGCVTSDAGQCVERQWYHTDALGSVLARTDVTGAIVAQFDYEPWGERWNAAGLVAGVDGDRQYNGRVYDAGTGFHDYGARLYWPEIGRFVSADTYLGDPANPASLNRYSYVWNNPYKYVDPNGRNPIALVNFAQRAMQWCQSGGCQAAGNAALAAAATVAAWAGIQIAKDAAKSDATLLPDSAWDKKAPHPQNAKNKYGPPGETIDWERYNPDTGELEKSKVTYDEFGRQKVRTDYTDHGDPDAHENPHHEDTEYGPGRTDGEKSGPKPGPGKGHPETLKPSGG